MRWNNKVEEIGGDKNRRLTSVNRFRLFYRLDSVDSDMLEMLLWAAQDVVSAYCNRDFGWCSVVETWYPGKDNDPAAVPGGVNVLQSSVFPVTSIEYLKQQGTVLGLDSYYVNLTLGQVYKPGVDGLPVPWSAAVYEMKYSGGYVAKDDNDGIAAGGVIVPPGLELAILKYMFLLYAQQGRDPGVSKIEESVVGVGSVRREFSDSAANSGALPAAIADMLGNYRAIPIA